VLRIHFKITKIKNAAVSLRSSFCSAAAAAAANKLKRRRIGHKLADEMKNHLSTMALILSWYAEGQSHEQELRTVLPAFWMSTLFPDLRSMNFVSKDSEVAKMRKHNILVHWYPTS
jgi:hypothetical protein